MPAFRLEGPAKRPTHSPKPQLIYTKNLYSDGVKIECWEEKLHKYPIDEDPFCQGKVNHFLSHYNRLGLNDVPGKKSETQERLEQVFIRDKMVPDKLIDNYYTFKDDTCGGTKMCPRVCADDFLTTMQHSYQLPKPYVMHRLAFPKLPYLRNQKYIQENPDLSPFKFYDDNFTFVTCQLQKHKSFRWTSYNPNTGSYTETKF